MSTLTPLKCYTLSRQPLMYQDLSVRDDGRKVCTVAYSSTGAPLDTSRSLRIYEDGLSGSVVCVAVADQETGLEIRLPGLNQEHKHRKYRVESFHGANAWQDEFRLKLSKGGAVAWRRVQQDEIAVSAHGFQMATQVAKTTHGDWKLVSVREASGEDERENEHEDILAVYMETKSGKKALQKARLYFITALGSELEYASLAALLALEKWYMKAQKGKIESDGKSKKDHTLPYLS